MTEDAILHTPVGPARGDRGERDPSHTWWHAASARSPVAMSSPGRRVCLMREVAHWCGPGMRTWDAASNSCRSGHVVRRVWLFESGR